MHVGHLRSAIIGDCLQRLFRANAWNVVGDVHLGDWGLQMGQLIGEVLGRGLMGRGLFRGQPHRDESGQRKSNAERDFHGQEWWRCHSLAAGHGQEKAIKSF